VEDKNKRVNELLRQGFGHTREEPIEAQRSPEPQEDARASRHYSVDAGERQPVSGPRPKSMSEALRQMWQGHRRPPW
jgi:hypothetical protein